MPHIRTAQEAEPLYYSMTHRNIFDWELLIIANCKVFYQLGTRSAPGWSIVTLRFPCLSVCPSVTVWGGLGMSLWRQLSHMVVLSYMWLVCSPPHCKRKQNVASTIDSKGTALITQAQYRKSSPRITVMARNRRLTTNKPRSEIALVLQYSVSCKQAP